MGLRLLELRWLGQQQLPMWGGHLDRGEPLSDLTMCQMIADGLIEAVERPCPGYVLTPAGHQYVKSHIAS